MPLPRLPERIAAVDLGSNSFHLVVARSVHGQLDVIDRLKEPVRLADGLRDDDTLEQGAVERAISCLHRFGQLVRGIPQGAVRAVGTNTLRRARDNADVLRRAQDALGHPIDIISGVEEARLIYLGVAHDLHQDVGRRLVIDIGGGSTELIVGEGFEPVEATSLSMGCVAFTRRFFGDGRITRRALGEAVLAARLELEPWGRRFRSLGWQGAVGSSGTILAIESILRESGWADASIARAGMAQLEEALLEAARIDALDLPGLQPTRAQVLPGGFAILHAVMESLDVRELITSQGALREGLLQDLRGRIVREDARDRTVQRFARRHHVDRDHASRVERTVVALHRQVASAWGLEDDCAPRVLAWAAQLHEVGLTIAYSKHHEHGAYLVTHSDLPGFTRGDQRILAALIRNHRRKVAPNKLPAAPPPLPGEATLRLVALLRIAVLLNRSRSADAPPAPTLRADGDALTLTFPAGWLDARPLTRADLEQEAHRLRAVDIVLEVD